MDLGTPVDYLKAKLDRSREDLTDAHDFFQIRKHELEFIFFSDDS